MKQVCIWISVICICISCVPQKPGGPLEQSLNKHQPDVPVPVNYTYNEDESIVKEFPSFRLCEMVYLSTSDARHGIEAVKSFYKRMMGTYEWDILPEMEEKKVLIFRKTTKENEYCRIEIYRSGAQTTIYILIGNKKLVTAG